MSIFAELVLESEKKKEEVKKYSFKRYLFPMVKREAKPFICIVGMRGVGKTVLLLQLANCYEKSLYLDAEFLLFYGMRIYDVVREGIAKGYKHFFIDEIHRYPNWQRELKLLYDFTNARITFSGSSSLSLHKGSSDLSRRAVLHRLKPLSFREYLSLKTGKKLPSFTLSQILDKKEREALITSTGEYYKYFTEYISEGALPIFFSNEFTPQAYTNILKAIVEKDILSIFPVSTRDVEAAYKIVKLVSTSDPNELSFSSLSKAVGINIHSITSLVSALASAYLFRLVLPKAKGAKLVRKEYKVLLSLPFRAALCREYGVSPSIGGLREDFFANSFDTIFYLKSERRRKTPDYFAENAVFEIGGRSKSRRQISGFKRSFLVVDDLTYDKDKIPLYLFGFLY